MADGERRRAEQAHQEVQQVQQQAERDRLAARHAERVQEQGEQALTDAEAGDRDRQHLGDQHRRHEREQRGGADPGGMPRARAAMSADTTSTSW